jgi:hypothetical protein
MQPRCMSFSDESATGLRSGAYPDSPLSSGRALAPALASPGVFLPRGAGGERAIVQIEHVDPTSPSPLAPPYNHPPQRQRSR